MPPKGKRKKGKNNSPNRSPKTGTGGGYNLRSTTASGRRGIHSDASDSDNSDVDADRTPRLTISEDEDENTSELDDDGHSTTGQDSPDSTSTKQTETSPKTPQQPLSTKEDETEELKPETKRLYNSQAQKQGLDDYTQYAVIIICLCTIAAVLLTLIYTGTPPEIEHKTCEILDNPADEIQRLSIESIPPQTKHFWGVVKSNLRSVARNKHRPACIVITPDSLDTGASDVIKKLSELIECSLTGLNSSFAIQGAEFSGNGRHSALDRKLESWFDSGHKTVIIYDIDRFTIETAHAFYKFCDDNDDPKYPGTMLLLTTAHSKDESPLPKNWLDLRLRNSWSNNDDEITPLLSRVANSWTELSNTSQSQRSEL